MSDVPYQQQPQVDQLEAERANAVAYGQKDRVTAVDKQLAGFGVKSKAAEERKAAAGKSDDGDTARSTPPKGRSTRGPADKTADA